MRGGRVGAVLTCLCIGAWWMAVDGSIRPAASQGAVRSLLEIRQEGVVLQNWDLSCGAAALTTILKYQYGNPTSEREVALGLMGREEYLADPGLIADQQGFSLLDLKLYVDRRGYKGVGYGHLTLQSLVEKAPVMVAVSFDGYDHFVVFRGILDNRVLLADPAWGNLTMTVDEFEDAWIEYPEFGRVGFVVALSDGTLPPNLMAPLPEDFVFLR